MDERIAAVDPQVQIPSLLWVMIKHAESGCPKIAALVAHQLAALVRLNQADPLLNDTAARLAKRWRAIQATGIDLAPSVH